jgi:hypothetical protein
MPEKDETEGFMLYTQSIAAFIVVLFLTMSGLPAFSPVQAEAGGTAPRLTEGQLSAPSNISADTIPGRPLELKVSWSAVAGAEGYIVWIRREALNLASAWDRLAVVDKTDTSLIEDDIDPKRTYEFKVQAFNGKGVGPDSVVASVRSLSH